MLTREEFCKTHSDIRVGLTAYSINGEKLGMIERVDDVSFIVGRGWFFHKDFAVPYDDIDDVREAGVVIRQRSQDLEVLLPDGSHELP